MKKISTFILALFLLLSVSGNLFSQVDLSSGLVAYYPFNGNTNDESGNDNHGTNNGATLTADRFGNADKAMSFDADWVDIPALVNGFNNLIV